MQKTSGNVFLGHLGEFFIFSLGCTQPQRCPQYPSEFLWIMLLQNLHVTIFSSSHMQPLSWSSLSQKIENSWKLLLTVVTESFIVNMAGPLDLTLKPIDKFRLRQ